MKVIEIICENIDSGLQLDIITLGGKSKSYAYATSLLLNACIIEGRFVEESVMRSHLREVENLKYNSSDFNARWKGYWENDLRGVIRFDENASIFSPAFYNAANIGKVYGNLKFSSDFLIDVENGDIVHVPSAVQEVANAIAIREEEFKRCKLTFHGVETCFDPESMKKIEFENTDWVRGTSKRRHKGYTTCDDVSM